MQQKRSVGIYIGAFDPVHSGHVGFALQAAIDKKLDSIYFLPERFPENNPTVTHSTHRAAMIRRVTRPYQQLGVVEVVDKQFTFSRTIPKLLHQFRGTELYVLLDAGLFLKHAATLAQRQSLASREKGYVVSVKNPQEVGHVLQAMEAEGISDTLVTIIKNTRPDVSSRAVRGALELGLLTRGVLPSVRHYAREAWLYIRLPRR